MECVSVRPLSVEMCTSLPSLEDFENKFNRTNMKNNESIEQYLNKMSFYADKIKMMSENSMADDRLVKRVLLGVTSAFSDYACIMFAQEPRPPMNEIFNGLKRVEQFQKEVDRTRNTTSTANQPHGCSHCGKRNHSSSKCWYKKDEKKILTFADIGWLIHTGATSHMCHDEYTFSTLKLRSDLPHVRTATGDSMAIKGVGTVDMTLRDTQGNDVRTITLTDVLYVPGMSTNVMSVLKICERGHTMTMDKDATTIHLKNSKEVIRIVDNLF